MKHLSVAVLLSFNGGFVDSAESLIKKPPPGAPVPPILSPVDGYLFLDKAKFRNSFAADVG